MTLRRCLNVLLMLVMLTPSMVCFKSICAAGMMAGGTMPCCKEMAAHKAAVTLINDCMNNDLAQAGILKMPMPDGAFLFAALAAFTFLILPPIRRNGALHLARPPPELYSDPFAILLATQRFRN